MCRLEMEFALIRKELGAILIAGVPIRKSGMKEEWAGAKDAERHGGRGTPRVAARRERALGPAQEVERESG